MSRALHRRLLRLNQGTGPKGPITLLPGRLVDDAEATALLRYWGGLVAQDVAQRTEPALGETPPSLSR